MADRTRSEQRKRRSEGRERRRSLLAKPFEALDEAVGEEGAARSALTQTAKTAAAGAVAAGIAGAAKALADRHDADAEEEGEERPAEPEAAEPQAEVEDEPQAQEASEPDDEPEVPAPRGASTDELTEIVEVAKQKLEELLGAEAERVSGFNRTDGRWTVTLEVVNLHRVPDTTDVMSSYELAFDDDRNLVSASETRRYRRSQTEEGR